MQSRQQAVKTEKAFFSLFNVCPSHLVTAVRRASSRRASHVQREENECVIFQVSGPLLVGFLWLKDAAGNCSGESADTSGASRRARRGLGIELATFLLPLNFYLFLKNLNASLWRFETK